MRHLADVVLRLMQSRNLTATAVAAKAGLHVQTLNQWLRGERTTGPLASVLGRVLGAIDQTRGLSVAEQANVLGALGVVRGVRLPGEKVGCRG